MPKFHTLTIKSIDQETKDCVSIGFDVPPELRREYQFIPGQYLTLKTEIDGESVRRSYSICSSPVDPELKVAVKKLEEGLFSTFANEILKPGDTLDVMTPMGRFYTNLDEKHKKHYLAFAAGSGITPIFSILRSVLYKEPKSRFTLFYGNRKSDSIIFKEQIEGLKNEYMDRLSVYNILSRESQDIDLFSGRLSAEKCRIFFDRLVDIDSVDEFLICGPQQMIESIKDLLLELGIDRQQIHFELFTTDTTAQKQKVKVKEHKRQTACTVEVTLDASHYNIEMMPEDQTILDAGHRVGLDLPFACKGGVCCTCRAKILEGSVDMIVNYALEPEEVEAGYVLTCQSVPTSDSVKISFDD